MAEFAQYFNELSVIILVGFGGLEILISMWMRRVVLRDCSLIIFDKISKFLCCGENPKHCKAMKKIQQLYEFESFVTVREFMLQVATGSFLGLQ